MVTYINILTFSAIQVTLQRSFLYTGWTSRTTPVLVEPFNEVAGPKLPLPQTPLEIFSLFFTASIIQYIVTETNRYAAQCLGEGKEWSTDEEEIKAYLGFCILMGIVRLPEVRDYWSTNKLLYYSPIASRISRNRFETISSYLHF